MKRHLKALYVEVSKTYLIHNRYKANTKNFVINSCLSTTTNNFPLLYKTQILYFLQKNPDQVLKWKIINPRNKFFILQHKRKRQKYNRKNKQKYTHVWSKCKRNANWMKVECRRKLGWVSQPIPTLTKPTILIVLLIRHIACMSFILCVPFFCQ